MSTYIERYLKKTKFEEITYLDFKNFLQQGIEENQNLEYKPRGLLVKQDDSIISSNNPHEITGFSALAKSVVGFANAEGGLLVLGVKEKPEKFKGTVVKIKPGVISPLPLNITREMIESQLLAKIQYPIDGVKIVQLRSSKRSKHSVFLIDVPQSHKAPHRVNELYYYQRYNFSTNEMKHYQISDLFGRRLAPSLEVSLSKSMGKNEDKGHFSFNPLIHNKGQSVAKYVTCICKIISGSYKIIQSKWHIRQDLDNKVCQYSTGFNSVIYPEIPQNTGYIEFQPINSLEETKSNLEPLVLSFGLYAEGMTARENKFFIIPSQNQVFPVY